MALWTLAFGTLIAVRSSSVAGALLSDRTVLLPGRRVPSRPFWVVFRNTGLQWDMESVQAKTAFDSSKEGATIFLFHSLENELRL